MALEASAPSKRMPSLPANRAMKSLGKFAVGVAVLGISISGVAIGPAHATNGAVPIGAATSRSAVKCSVPAKPRRAVKTGDYRSAGIRHRTYQLTKRSPLSISLYYRAAAPRHTYRVLGWGGGITYQGPNAGSGFGLTARSVKCGYLAIEIGANKGQPSHIVVCSGATAAVLTECPTSSDRSEVVARR